MTVIGLTGSSGKTTTKDLIAQLAGALGPTVAPAGSFNNELGHPYTVLQADEKTRFLVLEMGARGPGHLRYLAGIAPPRIGVVLNVGVAHIGEFGSVDGIAAAKGELVEAVARGRAGRAQRRRPGGSGDGRAHPGPRDRSSARRPTRTYGRVDVTVDERGRASYTLVVRTAAPGCGCAVPGRHQVGNSLAAAAVARELGMPLARARRRRWASCGCVSVAADGRLRPAPTA